MGFRGEFRRDERRGEGGVSGGGNLYDQQNGGVQSRELREGTGRLAAND